MVSGKVKLYVTCFCIRSSSPDLQVNIFFFSCFFFYKMTLDDESDPFYGEVSLRWNYQDETFISTIHAFLIILDENLSAYSEGC